jgi:hypothetical protein
MKPAFLTRPLDWTRASRGASDPIGYACSISATKPTPYRVTDLLIAVLAVGAIVAIIFGVI